MSDRARPKSRKHRTLWKRWRDDRLVLRIPDDRGRQVAVLDPLLVKASPTTGEGEIASRLAWARTELRAGTFGLRLLVASVLSWLAFPVLEEVGASAGVAVMTFVLLLIGLLVLNRIWVRSGTTRRCRRVAAQLAGAGICPTCAYSIAELQEEHDGCTVCPECGGAWKYANTGDGLPTPFLHAAMRRRVWRRRAYGVLRDDRRETHATMRIPEAELLALPWSTDHCERIRVAISEARDVTRTSQRWFGCSFFLIASMFFIMLLYAAWMASQILFDRSGFMGPPPVWVYAVAAAFLGYISANGVWFVLLARSMFRGDWWDGTPKGRARLVQNRVCAACFADLKGVDTEADACTVCPACGSAWRILRDEGAGTS